MNKWRLLCLLLIFGACKQKQAEDKLYKTGDPVIDKLSIEIAENPDDAELFFLRGEQFYKKELFDEAIGDLNTALSLDSLQADYYHLLSNAYMDYFKSKQSLQVMEKAAKLFPDRILTLLKLSETQMILKKFEDMNVTLRRIISKDPQNAEAYFMMGLLLRETGELDKAKNALQSAVEFDAELIDAWLILGSIYEDEQNPLALTYYKSATEINPQDVQALHSLAFYYQNNDNVDKALDTYREINLINKNYRDAYLNAGILYLEKEDLVNAKEQFEILVGIDPKFFLAYYYRGLVNEQLGEIESAKNDYQTCLNFNPKYERAQSRLDNLNKAS
jgi:tetratricopeptide (TPR) repeat protein